MAVDCTPQVTDEEVACPVKETTGHHQKHNVMGSKRDRSARRWLVLLALVAPAVTAGIYVMQFRPDEQTDGAAAQLAVRAASEGTIAVLSYSAESLDRDFANARSHLTGEFLAYYNQFTSQFVAPAARRSSVAATARVVRAASAEIHSGSAVVVLFVNQEATSRDRPTPAVSASAVRVVLTNVQGVWLITKFDPI